MERKLIYFDKPTQLKFWDVDGDHYTGGIGYHGDIICGDCGGLIDPEEVYEFAPDGIEPVVLYEDWVNLSEEIIGD